MKHLTYINKYFYKYRKQLIWGVLITIIARLFSLVMPKSVQYAIKAVEAYLASPTSEKKYRECSPTILFGYHRSYPTFRFFYLLDETAYYQCISLYRV